LAEIHFPNEMTCGFGAAGHCLGAKHARAKATKMSDFLDMMIGDWHRRQIDAMTVEHQKGSVFLERLMLTKAVPSARSKWRGF
jgi:hypothetical protein